ncbi:MAG: hypothetical protein IJ222_05385 [Bacteroidales bacterium]|nr:hypothetical protein [Bacteroidales bacterium]
MSIFGIHKKVEETLYLPVGPMPWPEVDNDIWLVTGVLAPDCLELTYDLSMGLLRLGYRIQSFPYHFANLTSRELAYNFPGERLALGELTEMEFRKAVAAALNLDMKPGAGYLIRKNPGGEGFLVAEIVAKTNHEFIHRAQAYRELLPDISVKDNVKFSKMFRDGDEEVYLGENWDIDYPEEISDELASLARDTKKNIEDLILQDFPVEVIETWLQKAVKLSRVEITADYRILLTDYGKEIKMRQLPKTLFLWFLAHPGGCSLKRLQEHRDELLAIYRKLTNQDDEAQVVASIDALVNPVGNSFSEKCAAVKLAFLKEIPERVAKNYYIQGPQGGVKGISLDRALVEWE